MEAEEQQQMKAQKKETLMESEEQKQMKAMLMARRRVMQIGRYFVVDDNLVDALLINESIRCGQGQPLVVNV